MKVATIMKKQARENMVHDTAIKMRKLLDEAEKAYGDGWDDDDVEQRINELVFGEDDEDGDD